MKRFLVFCGVLFLTACSQANAGLTLTLDQTGHERKAELIAAAERVVTRRLERLGQKMKGMSVTDTASGALLRFSVADPAHRTALEQELVAPFFFRVMVEAPLEQADTENGYRETGITEEHLAWAAASPSQVEGRGNVLLLLNEEGQELLRGVIERNQGKKLGIFVRGVLVTYKTIAAQDEKASIPIDNIPSFALASVFADDVNVSAHVMFSPSPVNP